MRKSIKVLVFVLIAMFIIPVGSYAEEVIPSQDNTAKQIVQWFNAHVVVDEWGDKTVDLSGISNKILIVWNEKMQRAVNARQIREEVGEPILGYLGPELERRGISRNDYEFKEIKDEHTIGYWEPSSTGGNEKLKDKTEKILGIIQGCGSVVSVIVLVIIGIKYMFVSVYEKAKYKEVIIPYMVGCTLLFAVTNVVAIIYKWASNL